MLVRASVQFVPDIVAGRKSVNGALFRKSWQTTCGEATEEAILPVTLKLRLVTRALAAGEMKASLSGRALETNVAVKVNPVSITKVMDDEGEVPDPAFQLKKAWPL